MTLTISRVLSLAIVGMAHLRAWHIGLSGWYVTLCIAPLLVLIWFPNDVDELTFGVWYQGYRIDSHTPGVLIAAFGWMFLVLITLILFKVHAVRRFVGS
jgi:hypothetical protein